MTEEGIHPGRKMEVGLFSSQRDFITFFMGESEARNEMVPGSGFTVEGPLNFLYLTSQ